MGLRGYLSVLRARWVVVVSCALVGLILAGGSSLRAPRIYQTKASVFFSVSVSQNSRELTSGFSYVQGLVTSYAQLATQPPVLQPVIDQLGLKVSPKQLAGAIDAQAPLDTVIIDIVVSNSSATLAASIANAVARQLSVIVGRIGSGSLNPQTGSAPATSESLVGVTVVSPAAVPSAVSSPRINLNLTLGLVIGAFLGIILAFVRDVLDPRVGGRRDVERLTDIPVIGTIVQPINGSFRRRWTAGRGHQLEEQAKELRTNFQHVRVARRLRTVVFTSAREDRATSLTVASLGSELAHAGIRTVVVDGDLRKPSLASWYGVEEGSLGLSSVLLGEVSWQDAVQHRGRTLLSVLPAGPAQTDPDLLRPAAIAALIAELAEHYDVVLIKAPPVLRVADGLLLSRIADGTIVVADGNVMHRDELTEEVQSLSMADSLVLGIVLMA